MWKPVTAAQLKMDDRPVRLWNIYQPEKKPELILVQIGLRYLLVDIELKEVIELAPENFQRKDRDLHGPLPADGTKPMDTDEWMIRPAGIILRVKVKLSKEGRVLEVQLPYRPELRKYF